MNSSEHIYSCFGDKTLPHLQYLLIKKVNRLRHVYFVPSDQLQSLPLSANRTDKAETLQVKRMCSHQAKNSFKLRGYFHFWLRVFSYKVQSQRIVAMSMTDYITLTCMTLTCTFCVVLDRYRYLDFYEGLSVMLCCICVFMACNKN